MEIHSDKQAFAWFMENTPEHVWLDQQQRPMVSALPTMMTRCGFREVKVHERKSHSWAEFMRFWADRQLSEPR